ncbi:heat shock protein 70 B2-like isoform X2 [Paramacrobiotus metropolitanus]|uniref:heat shock protein 70 B2-like isoform X2 n=1 Tax=Paramacrobiotus metropolitanus TaxID=2943436 RepID=UPI002445C3A6|nr:heat shock protein 70 B2-like isoform X2 [Paramacrobiotus metropolitanus]
MGSDAPYCLAIDIGSSSIKAAAVYDGGSFRNFEIGFNNNPTEFPTYLAVTHSGAVLIGEEAKDHSTIEPHETLTNIKYLFNRKLERMTLPFPVDRCGGQVSVRVQHHNQRLNVPAHAIYGAFLAAAKERVEAILDQQCLTAVVTIPSDFSNEQKIAVEGASRLAGFTQVETMNEVIAAASYFYHMRNLQNEQFVIVCNFGASSSEIALVQICNNNDFAVLRRQTLLDITGDALDEKLLMHCLRSMNTSAIHSDRSSAESLKQNLRLQCEAARISLSNKREASVDVGSVMGTESSSNVPVDREFFESMSDLWTALRNTLRDILQLAVSKTKRPIHIILTGGVSRTPKIRSVIEECSQGMNVQITTNVNLCNNAVVYGGALRAKAAFPEEFCYSVNRGPEELNLQDRIWRTLESAPLAPESGFGGLEQLSPTPSRRSGVSSRSTSSNNTSSSSISRASQQPDIFRFIGNELLTTERKYVQDLYFIVSECMPYFQQNELLAPSVIGRRHLIFANLEDIYLFHRIFLTDMESCELTPSTIGHLFCRYEQEFEKHALFCRKQAESTRKGLIAAANRFFEDQKFVFSREDGGLGTCLTKPFQRLVKYKEFLKRLITKCLEAGLNEDLPVLQAALEKMEFFLHHGDDLAHQDLIVDHAGVALNQQGRLLRQNEILMRSV